MIKMWLKSHGFAFIIVIALLVPVLLYWVQFHEYNLSKEPSDWGVFGDYIGGVYSVLIALLVVYISRRLDKRDEEEKYKKESLRKIHKQLTSIRLNQTVNQNKLTKFYRLIEEGRLYIDPDLYERLKNLANSLGENGRNRQLEIEMLDEIKEEYDGN